MAYSISTAVSEQEMERRKALGFTMADAIKAMKEGRDMLRDDLWDHPGFRACVKNELAKMGALQKEADKLAIIREVFGGRP